MYASGIGTSRGARFIERQAYLVTRAPERLAVARRMYGMRFPGEDVSSATMQQLRGREGARVKRLYRQAAQEWAVPWKGRVYQPGDAFAAGDDVNRLLSAGHACLYGVCHAAIVGLGASPALGFVHSGGATSFVLDIADLYKAEYTIPTAFRLAAAGQIQERDARLAFRDKVADGGLMRRVVEDVQDLLFDGAGPDEGDDGHLWDERVGAVLSGRDYSHEPPALLGITSPELPVIPQDW